MNFDDLDPTKDYVIRHHYHKNYNSGLGDYFRCSFALFCHFRNMDNDIFRDKGGSIFLIPYFEGHPLEKYFVNPQERPNTTYINISSNSFNGFDYTKTTENDKKDYLEMLSKFLTDSTRSIIADEFEKFPFCVAIHIRCGDAFCDVPNPHVRFDEGHYDEIISNLLNLRKYIGEYIPIRLFSDSSKLKRMIINKFKNDENFYTSNLAPVHTALSRKGEDQLWSLVEFFLLFRAKHIYTFISRSDNRKSISTFSFTPAFLKSIPIKCIYYNKKNSKTYVRNISNYNLFYEVIQEKYLDYNVLCYI